MGVTTVPRRVVPTLLLVIPLSQIPLDVYTPALPEMAADLNTTSTAMQNTVTAYMLGLSLAFVPVGVIADAWGRKRVLLTCLGLIVVTSILCATADSVPFLLSVRFLQGAAASACMVLTYAIAADCFRGARLTSVSGLLGASWGLAPVLAPALGGVLVEFVSWRVVFVLIATLSALMAFFVLAVLPETLAPEQRSPIQVGPTWRAARETLRSGIFVCFVIVFGVMAAAQLAFGVAGPFLYQDRLGFSPAIYGVMALIVGVSNLAGELGCGYLAVRVAARKLAFGALGIFGVGAVVLVASATAMGVNAWAVTIGACLALAGCGVLCPQMYGLALGRFSHNLGLVGGIISAGCYLIVSAVIVIVGELPERDQGPLGWLYVSCGAIALVLLWWAMSSRRTSESNRAETGVLL